MRRPQSCSNHHPVFGKDHQLESRLKDQASRTAAERVLPAPNTPLIAMPKDHRTESCTWPSASCKREVELLSAQPKATAAMCNLVALSFSNWACHPKNLESPDCSCVPTGPPQNLGFPDCVVALSPSQLGLPSKNLEFLDCSCSPVIFQLGLPPKKSSVSRLQLCPVTF